ncbi:MAG: 3-dehydroquinate synthase [Coriobacteriia bacterium]
MKHVFLIGFMGSGKSTVGAALATQLGRPFVDLDRLIETRVGAPVGAIFAERGEEGFRRIEQQTLRDLEATEPSVVACGGGIVLRDENRCVLKENGTVVYLVVSPEEALARIGDAGDRPLLAGDSARIAPRILEARLSLYRAAADVIVDTSGRSVTDIVAEVATLLADPTEVCGAVAAAHGYDVVIGHGILDTLGEHVLRTAAPSACVVVTDTNVAPLYLDAALTSLEAAGIETHSEVVAAGESSKDWRTAGALLDRFAALRLDRSGCIVALGGGVVGDLAGFAAATYMRGVRFVQVPTTLLGQVDSSIGGKTGVDLTAGKNLAGAFWQPRVVVSDTATLATLPDAEWTNGLVEVAKTALLAGVAETSALEESAPRLLARDDAVTLEAVHASVRFKAAVVSSDERESDLRECLNLGHTLGHALEMVAGYGRISHGVAVAEGMRFAGPLAVELLGASESVAARTASMLDALGVPRLGARPSSATDLLGAILSDKKTRGGTARFVLLRAPGDWEVVAVEADVLESHLRRWIVES